MKPSIKNLERLKRNQDLVTIKRKPKFDHNLSGFILDFSETLVVIQEIDHFLVDACYVINLADIRKLQVTEGNKLHKQILCLEGDLAKVQFDRKWRLGSYSEVLEDLSEDSIVILENENNDEFNIGKIERLTDDSVSIRHFSPSGVWEKYLTKMSFSDITSCHIAGRYIDHYWRYFLRKSEL